MNEIVHTGPDNLVPDQLPQLEVDNFGDQALRREREAAAELRAAQEAWLERRNIEPVKLEPMDRRAFDLLRNAPPNYVGYAQDTYEIPADDQDDARYALVDIDPDDPNMPNDPVLMIVTEVDFGTTIDHEVINEDFQTPESSPDNPQMPDRSGGALKTVDIANTLATSAQGLRTFAAELMEGRTTDPLSGHYGDIGVRAGSLAPGQQDAYVSTRAPFANSVALTLLSPGHYDSVCVLRGQMREAANGKAGMAQIDNPEEVLRIDGENLRKLQGVYQELYHEPDFALTEEQRRARDETFNNYLAGQISSAARSNRDQEQTRADDEYRRRQPQLRVRQLPR